MLVSLYGSLSYYISSRYILHIHWICSQYIPVERSCQYPVDSKNYFYSDINMSDQHTTVQYQLRLPQELRDKIKESAGEHNRSMNADIVARLEQSFEAVAALTDLERADYEELKQELTQELKKDMKVIAEELSSLVDKFTEYKENKKP